MYHTILYLFSTLAEKMINMVTTNNLDIRMNPHMLIIRLIIPTQLQKTRFKIFPVVFARINEYLNRVQ